MRPARAAGPGDAARDEDADAARPRHARAAGFVLIGVAYIVVVPWLGYVPSLAALIAATARYQAGPLTGRVILVAAAAAAGFWLVFVVLLRIPQPAGVWPSLF